MCNLLERIIIELEVFFFKGRKGLPSIKRNRAKFKKLTDRLYSLLYMAEERTAD